MYRSTFYNSSDFKTQRVMHVGKSAFSHLVQNKEARKRSLITAGACRSAGVNADEEQLMGTWPHMAAIRFTKRTGVNRTGAVSENKGRPGSVPAGGGGHRGPHVLCISARAPATAPADWSGRGGGTAAWPTTSKKEDGWGAVPGEGVTASGSLEILDQMYRSVTG